MIVVRLPQRGIKKGSVKHRDRFKDLDHRELGPANWGNVQRPAGRDLKGGERLPSAQSWAWGPELGYLDNKLESQPNIQLSSHHSGSIILYFFKGEGNQGKKILVVNCCWSQRNLGCDPNLFTFLVMWECEKVTACCYSLGKAARRVV